MKIKRKAKLARYLAAQASNFYSELKDTFICPTCLAHIPADDGYNISEAHIIPAAAGGRLTTVICRKCNSTFGSKQDKWLGELLHLESAPQPSFLCAKTQKGHFEVGGLKVNGEYRVGPQGQIQLIVFEDQISPATKRQLEARAAARPRQLTVTIPFPPVFENDHAIRVGVVTAGYLLWFLELGYSWALQHHLDVVRKQILNPSENLLPKAAVVSLPKGEIQTDPFIGLASIAGRRALIASVGPMAVLFPRVDDADFYERLPPSANGLRAEVKIGNYGHRHGRTGPVGLFMTQICS